MTPAAIESSSKNEVRSLYKKRSIAFESSAAILVDSRRYTQIYHAMQTRREIEENLFTSKEETGRKTRLENPLTKAKEGESLQLCTCIDRSNIIGTSHEILKPSASIQINPTLHLTRNPLFYITAQ